MSWGPHRCGYTDRLACVRDSGMNSYLDLRPIITYTIPGESAIFPHTVFLRLAVMASWSKSVALGAAHLSASLSASSRQGGQTHTGPGIKTQSRPQRGHFGLTFSLIRRPPMSRIGDRSAQRDLRSLPLGYCILHWNIGSSHSSA